MNLCIALFFLILASPTALGDMYFYPKEKRPSISLKEASGIAERIIAQLDLKGYYAMNAVLFGDKEQTGSGCWNLNYCNADGKEIQIGVYFPEDRVLYMGPSKEGRQMEMMYTRDGMVSKWWLEQKEKMEERHKESDAFFKSREASDRQQSTDTEQGGTGQPATAPESKSEGGDKPQPEAEGRSR